MSDASGFLADVMFLLAVSELGAAMLSSLGGCVLLTHTHASCSGGQSSRSSSYGFAHMTVISSTV